MPWCGSDRDGVRMWMRAWDAAGNVSESPARAWTVDATAPTRSTVTLPSGPVGRSFPLSWTPSTDEGSGLAGYRVTIGAFSTMFPPDTTSGTVRLPDGMDSGTHPLWFSPIDNVGSENAGEPAWITVTAPPLPGRFANLATSVSAVAAGSPITVTGWLTTPVGAFTDEKVGLYLRPATAPATSVLLRTVTAADDGGFALTAPVPYAGRLEVRHAASAQLGAATAVVPAVKVVAAVSWSTRATSTAKRATVLRVQVRPADTRAVTLQQSTGRGWRSIATGHTRSGVAEFTHTFAERGTYRLRVVVASAPGGVGTTSVVRTQQVR